MELTDIFALFYDSPVRSYEIIDSGRGETDFRHVIIAELENGEKAVMKLSDNDFTSPERIAVWQRTVEEYHRLGYYCPRIFADKAGNFPMVSYEERKCTAFAEEYSKYRIADERKVITDSDDTSTPDRYADDAWIMTARIAALHLSYCDFPSGYCLFDTFCPSDKTDEVLEIANEWYECANTLPEELKAQADRIWALWQENRAALEPLYKKLPTSVLQADLNSTNILVNDKGEFAGVCDFNLCGREVLLNYIMRETNHYDFSVELKNIFRILKLVSAHYRFSEAEKNAALMLYRCLKPLWWNSLDKLKEHKDDTAALKKHLDETEYYLTADIDFTPYMSA